MTQGSRQQGGTLSRARVETLCNRGLVPDACSDGGEQKVGGRLWWYQAPAAPNGMPEPRSSNPAVRVPTSGETDRAYRRLLDLLPLPSAMAEDVTEQRGLSLERLTELEREKSSFPTILAPGSPMAKVPNQSAPARALKAPSVSRAFPPRISPAKMAGFVQRESLALPVLKDVGAREVLIAYDADHAELKIDEKTGKPKNDVYGWLRSAGRALAGGVRHG